MQKLTVEQAKMNGALDIHPGRYKNSVPKSQHPLGSAPKYFTTDERKIWKEIAEVTPANVLTGTDRYTVEAVCLLLAKMRRREEMRGADLTSLVHCLGKLGMTPVDRQKLNVLKETDAPDEFSDFVN